MKRRKRREEQQTESEQQQTRVRSCRVAVSFPPLTLSYSGRSLAFLCVLRVSAVRRASSPFSVVSEEIVDECLAAAVEVGQGRDFVAVGVGIVDDDATAWQGKHGRCKAATV